MTIKEKFWEHTPLSEMTQDQWEAICDGCGLCCLVRLEDEGTGEIVTTNIACKYLDLNMCQCKDYANRHINVPECIKVTPQNIDELAWLPVSCSYRRLANKEGLADWHYLVCGDKNRVHEEGISWKDELLSESEIDINEYIISDEKS